jgi:hypothetical protein
MPLLDALLEFAVFFGGKQSLIASNTICAEIHFAIDIGESDISKYARFLTEPLRNVVCSAVDRRVNCIIFAVIDWNYAAYCKVRDQEGGGSNAIRPNQSFDLFKHFHVISGFST